LSKDTKIMSLFRKKPVEVRAITFDELVD